MARKRRFTVFSLSFLDVMSCGFGAVVLIFLVINHRIDADHPRVDRVLLAESRKLDFLIEDGQADLAELEERVLDRRKRVADARRRLVSAIADRDRRRKDTDELEAETIARQESIEELKADVETREEDVRRLQAEEEAQAGAKLRRIEGEGDRQYLTGLYVGGSHVLIALDTSASMLDETIVQIVRRRNMAPERQRSAPKWQRALRTVEWLAAQVPFESNFQILAFATEAAFVVPDRVWIEAMDPVALDDALRRLENIVPAGGTNLEAFAGAVASMNPLPDNIFLVTDGLPTRATREPRRATVTGQQRIRIFQDAAKNLPRGVPINPILLPLEGDDRASAAYWKLARATGGTYMSPSADWP